MTGIDDSAPAQVLDESLEFRLDKVRAHANSKLSHQSHLALILSAVEENLDEQNTDKTPAAYFVSFLSLLDQCFSTDEITNKELANSAVYLLDLVCPYVSSGLLKSKFTPILEKLALALGHPDAEAPLLRASIGVLESILLAQDSASWNEPATQLSPRRGIVGLLALGLDPRPKVRKRAQEAIHKVLSHPPPSPKLEHPAATLCADTALKNVATMITGSKGKKGDHKDAHVIHALQLVKAITSANGWPMDKVDDLCEMLLSISKTSDQYLVVATFEVFESVFRSISEDVNSAKLEKILESIFDLTPSIEDQHLAPSWLAVVAQAAESYCRVLPKKCFAKLPSMFDTITGFLESSSENVRISGSQCLVALATTAIPDEVLLGTKSSKVIDQRETVLSKVCNSAFGLLHVKFQGSWKETMEVLVALFDKLRWRSNPHLINALKVVGALRTDESFNDGRVDADKVIAAAIRALGPETVLKYLPLNLEAGQAARAWMLPLLRDNVYCANLSHFIDYFVPLSSQLTAKVAEMEAEPEKDKHMAMQIKIWQTINDQIWSLLPRYSDLPMDLRKAFTQSFAELLGSRLYSNVDERSSICQSLRLLVESNVAYAEGAVDDDQVLLQRFPKEEATKNIEYLSKEFGQNLLKTLFNVFVMTTPEHRGFILETITAYLAILSPEDVIITFNNVSKLLNAELEKNESGGMDLALVDLIVAMTPFLSQKSHNSLLSIFVILARRDDAPQLQKKAYRILSRMAEAEGGEKTLEKSIGHLESLLIETSKNVATPARGARLNAMTKVLQLIPKEDLHFIPCILPETVLCTKDVNEKTRDAAFELLVQMGHKMQHGGTVDQSKIPDVDAESASTTEASLEEFFTMTSAGLAGDSAHMISASIVALSRVIFEFRNQISTEFLANLSSTVEVFLEHNNREIVKSTLGFVKITAVSLPVEIVEPQLKSLIEHLLVWSHEHKAHFRAKVKHIIERLMRRFGYDKIAQVFPEADMKLLTNIRKSKERAKRQKKTDEDGTEKKGPKYANEFDQAIYGSSDEEDDDEDMEEPAPTKGGKGHAKEKKYILEKDDEPLDFLDKSSLAHISSSKPQKGKPTLKNKFAQDASGKIIVKDDDSDDDDKFEDVQSGIDAYVSAIKSGPVRGQRNKLKYKRSRKHRDDDDEEEDDDDDKHLNANNKRARGGRGDAKSNNNNRPAKNSRPKKAPRRKL
uniref:ARAD1D46442p n=1 Tax=Blastobotrys adeninivorans TaxID=409370 RepID=A0A060TIG9_BLAAD